MTRLVALALLVALLAPGVASAATAPPAPAPVARVDGLDSNQFAGVNPADVQVAVGPGTLVETVNSSIAVWTTGAGGATRVRTQTLGAFFSGGGVDRSPDDMSDPRVLWDGVSGRFFAAVFDISRLELDVAVSAAADPAGAWTVWALPSTGCPDQPRLGTSDAVVVVTDNLFSSCARHGSLLGGEVVVLSKPDLLAAAASPRRATFGPDPRFAAVTPVQSLGAASTEYLVAVQPVGAAIELMHVDSADIPSLPIVEVPLPGTLQAPPVAPQAGTSIPVDVGDNRIQNAVFEHGSIWLTAAAACEEATRSCARVVQLDPVAGTLLDDTTIGLSAGRFLFYPAIAPDDRGNVVVAYGYSSNGDAPGLGWTYVRPDGVVASTFDVAAGTAANESGRFGDYSGAARDPRDPSLVWIGAEVGAAADGTTLGWASTLAAVRVPAQAPAVVRAGATRAAGGATVTATVYPEGSATTYRVEHGTTTGYGATTAAASLADATSPQQVSVPVRLAPGRTYHLRVVAVNATGTSAGPDTRVAAAPAAPALAYPAAAAARAGGETVLRALVTPNGAATSVVFEYGATRAYGARVRAPAVAGSAARTLVAVRLRSLQRGRLVHFRVVAENRAGRTVGPDRTVRT